MPRIYSSAKTHSAKKHLARSGIRKAAAKSGNKPSADALTRSLKRLALEYDFTAKEVAEILDVTSKTLSRYQENAQPVSEQQADRINVVETILDLGKRVLGSEQEVKRWLHRPVHSLENQRPINLIVSESGRRRVENVLLQVEGGSY